MSIARVAKLAGVSRATVSRVLNSTAVVSEELRARVERAVAATGYQPSAVARALSQGRSQLLTLIAPDLESHFFLSLLSHVERAASEAGYSVLLANSGNDPARELQHLKAAKDHLVAGVIWCPVKAPRRDIEVPECILVDRSAPGYPCIRANHLQAGRLATEHLLGLGHRHIAFIDGTAVSSSRLRRTGYRQALRNAGLNMNSRLIVKGAFDFDSGVVAAKQLLKTSESFTALIAANDMMALGAMSTLRRAGYRVPEEISVMGFDGVNVATLVEPALTTVAQPIPKLASQAVAALLRRLDDRTGSFEDHVLDVELVQRESTGPPLERGHKTQRATSHATSRKVEVK